MKLTQAEIRYMEKTAGSYVCQYPTTYGLVIHYFRDKLEGTLVRVMPDAKAMVVVKLDHQTFYNHPLAAAEINYELYGDRDGVDHVPELH